MSNKQDTNVILMTYPRKLNRINPWVTYSTSVLQTAYHHSHYSMAFVARSPYCMSVSQQVRIKSSENSKHTVVLSHFA